MTPPHADDSASTLNAVEHTRWFTEEVHPHERSLRSYLQGAFPQLGDVDDVVQESYLRTLRAKASQPIRSARGFLFSVARRLVLDILRRDNASPIEGVDRLETLSVIDDDADVTENVGRRERI